MGQKLIRNYKNKVIGEMSSEGVFRVRKHSSQEWVYGNGWAIESYEIDLAKSEGATVIEVYDIDSGDIWKTDVETLMMEGYESPTPWSSKIHMFLPADYWEVSNNWVEG